MTLVEEEHFLPCPQNYITFGASFIILRTLINQNLKVIATMREFLGNVWFSKKHPALVFSNHVTGRFIKCTEIRHLVWPVFTFT